MSARKRSLFAAGAAQIAFATAGVRVRSSRGNGSAAGGDGGGSGKQKKKSMTQLMREPVKTLSHEDQKRRSKVRCSEMLTLLHTWLMFLHGQVLLQLSLIFCGVCLCVCVLVCLHTHIVARVHRNAQDCRGSGKEVAG